MNSLAAAASLPEGVYVDLMAISQAVSFGSAVGVSELVHGEAVVDVNSDRFQQTYMISSAGYTAITLGAGVWQRSLTATAATGINAVNAARGTHIVYQGVDKSGVVRYIGRTSRDVLTRAAEHIAAGGGKQNLIYRAVPGGTNLTLQEARILEQQLINQYGMAKNGGQLLNKINSIAQKYWAMYGISP
jgi:hypothetical protein